MSNRNDLPSPSASNFNQRLRETIQTYLGRQGDPLDRGLTLRDLIENSIVKLKDGFSLATGGRANGALPLVLIPTSAIGVEPDLTPPPQPSGFTVTAAVSHVFIEHAPPAYSQGHGHLRTHVYGVTVAAGAPLPVFNAAVEVGQFTGDVWSMPSNPATTWRLWIKWETNDGVLSPTPAGGTNGLEAITGQDVATLLHALNGQITESQLYQELGDRIKLIDDPSTGLLKKVGDLQTTYGNTVSSAESALSAAQSASASAASEANAILAKNAALASKNSAAEYATQSQTSATTAATKASEASTSATQSAASATGAAGSASAASTSATTAANSATTATDKATAASTSATNAATSATAAGNSATASNTAKLAAESAKDAAAGSATAAATSASTASTKATEAGTSATSASGSANTAATKAGEASTSATQAATSATNAAGSASNAQTSATTAANSATNAGNSATAASTSAQTAATKATEASQSATSASTSATTATTKAAAAGVSATQAASSETNAAGSASSAASALQTVQATVRNISLGVPLDKWALNGQQIVTISDGKVGNKALRLSGGSGYPNQGNFVPIDPTKKYRTRFWARPIATTAGLLYFSLQQFVDDSGNTGPVNGGRSPYKPSGVSRSTHNATYGTDQWGEYSFIWSAADWQAGVKFVRPDFLDNYSGQAGYWEVQDFTFTEVTALEGLSAAVQTEATARANETGQLFAKYGVKLDVNGYVTGWSMNNNGSTGSMVFRLDQFAIGSPGQNSIVPFTVQTTATTVNGVPVSAGVYMHGAYIMGGTLTGAQIVDGTIEGAKLINVKFDVLTGSALKASAYLSSTNYVAGSTGWRINADGTAEFSGVLVRGTIYASSGQIGGSTIGLTYFRSNNYVLGNSGWNFNSDGTGQVGGISFLANAMQSSNYVAGSSGWKLSRDGGFEANTGTFSGNVSGGQFTTGSYTGYAWPTAGYYGSYLGPGGLLLGNANNGKYFQVTADGNVYAPGFKVENGTMTINQANVINTLNIAGNAVTLPVGVQTTSNLTVGFSFSYQTMITLSMNTGGAPMYVNCMIKHSTNNNDRFNKFAAFAGETIISDATQYVTIDSPGLLFLTGYITSTPTGFFNLTIRGASVGGGGNMTILPGSVVFAIGVKR